MHVDPEIAEFLGIDQPQTAEIVSARGLSEWIGLSHQRISALARDGKIPRTEEGRFDLKPAVAAYCDYLREGQRGRTNTNPELQAAKVRAANAQAEKLEVANAKARGDLLNAADVQSTWTATVIDLRSAILAIPQRVSSTLGLDRRATRELDDEIRKSLEVIADG